VGLHILYIIILYITYTYTAYGFPIGLRAASSRSASASASDATVCVSRVYDVMTMPLTTRVQMYQLSKKVTFYSYCYTSNVTCFFIITFGISIKSAWLKLLIKLENATDQQKYTM